MTLWSDIHMHFHNSILYLIVNFPMIKLCLCLSMVSASQILPRLLRNPFRRVVHFHPYDIFQCLVPQIQCHVLSQPQLIRLMTWNLKDFLLSLSHILSMMLFTLPEFSFNCLDWSSDELLFLTFCHLFITWHLFPFWMGQTFIFWLFVLSLGSFQSES